MAKSANSGATRNGDVGGGAANFRNPHNLPTKICVVCRRLFTWRKKWERDWEQVQYCSDACRRAGKSNDAPTLSTEQVLSNPTVNHRSS